MAILGLLGSIFIAPLIRIINKKRNKVDE